MKGRTGSANLVHWSSESLIKDFWGVVKKWLTFRNFVANCPFELELVFSDFLSFIFAFALAFHDDVSVDTNGDGLKIAFNVEVGVWRECVLIYHSKIVVLPWLWRYPETALASRHLCGIVRHLRLQPPGRMPAFPCCMKDRRICNRLFRSTWKTTPRKQFWIVLSTYFARGLKFSPEILASLILPQLWHSGISFMYVKKKTLKKNTFVLAIALIAWRWAASALLLILLALPHDHDRFSHWSRIAVIIALCVGVW